MANRRRRKLKSWQRRRIRRIKNTIRVVLIFVFLILAILTIKSLGPYEKVDLCDYVTYTFSGYNTKGSVDAEINEELASILMQRLLKEYDSAFIHFSKCSSEDYNSFYNSLSVTVNSPGYLSNGTMFSYTVNYDQELAKRIKLKVKNDTREVMVSGLVTAAVIPLDSVFDGISITYEGISPTLKATLVNNITNPYLSDVEFIIDDEQEYYAEGDVIRVRAVFDEQQCLDKHFVIDAPLADCVKEFPISSDQHYVKSADELTPEFIQMAISAANNAFTTKTAKEYGVRVYFEANIAPVYVNKDSTFEWVSYAPLSAYLKVANSDIAGKNSNNYNDLDIVYNCTMTQADHKSINVEAVVRFRDIIIHEDGSYEYDFSNPSISSCSHLDSRIKKNVIYNYEDNYTIEKLNIKY